jgi:hypothetical protein
MHASEGPFPISRLAYAYRPVFVLDVDSKHTEVSARKPTRSQALQLRTVEAMRAGWHVRTLALPEAEASLRPLVSQPAVLALRVRKKYYRDRVRAAANMPMPRMLGYAFENLVERGTWTRLRLRLAASIFGNT